MRHKIDEHIIENKEREILNKLVKDAAPKFAELTGAFLSDAMKSGLTARIAGAALSLYGTTTLIKILTMCSGMPPEELDIEELDRIADEVHQQMAKLVSAYIIGENDKTMADFN